MNRKVWKVLEHHHVQWKKIAVFIAMFNMFNINAVDQRVTVLFCSSIVSVEIHGEFTVNSRGGLELPIVSNASEERDTLAVDSLQTLWEESGWKWMAPKFQGDTWGYRDTGIHQMATWPEGNFMIDRTILG